MREWYRRATFCLFILLTPLPAAAWAARAHRLVTDLAIDALPGACASLFREHRAELLARSVEPDTILRQHGGHREAIRHFIDLDAYMPYPFHGFPRFYREAVKMAGTQAVRDRGVLPWVILRLQHELHLALQQHKTQQAVELAGHLSHYVADAMQPLHLTVNHDGQLSRNEGVHLRLEIGMVDDRIDQYEAALRGHVAPGRQLSDLRSELFDGFPETYAQIDKIMRADSRSVQSVWRYGPWYYCRMDRALRPMIEKQLSRAASLLASIWFTACPQAASAS
jgi:hypothetical protein